MKANISKSILTEGKIYINQGDYEKLPLFSLNLKREHTFPTISTVKIEKNMGFLGILQMVFHLKSDGQL